MELRPLILLKINPAGKWSKWLIKAQGSYIQQGSKAKKNVSDQISPNQEIDNGII
jgi:hypothetical protein